MPAYWICIEDGDVVLTLGAGSIGGIAEKLPRGIELNDGCDDIRQFKWALLHDEPNGQNIPAGVSAVRQISFIHLQMWMT